MFVRLDVDLQITFFSKINILNYVVLLCIEFVILLIEEKVMSYVTMSKGHRHPLVGMESKVSMKKSNLVIIRISPLVLDLLCGGVRKITMTSCVILSKGLTNNLQN
jgi:hypothetical protein